MKADQVGAGLGEGLRRARRPARPSGGRRSAPSCRRPGRVRLSACADHRPDRQVRHVMVVHHVEVDPVGAGGDDARALRRRAARSRPKECSGAMRRLRHAVPRSILGRAASPHGLARIGAHGPAPSSRPASPSATCPSSRTATRASYAFAYTVTIKNSGDVTAPADRPPLDRQRRQRPRRGSARPGRRRPSAGPEARRDASSTPAGRASRRRTARCAAPSSA